MLDGQQSREYHEKFKELNALASSGTLTPLEWSELNSHLDHCEECREVSLQYQILATQGISTIADAYTDRSGQRSWDEEAGLKKLLARVRKDRRTVQEHSGHERVAALPAVVRRIMANSFVRAALAACIVVTVGFQAYRLGMRAQGAAIPAAASSEDRVLILTAEKKSADELLAAQTARLAQLQEQSSREERELSKLRAALREIEEHSKELAAANSQSGGKLQEFSQQRDTLNTQLQDANLAYQSVRTELTSLRAESDRDIRELMGARKLYIADVFDVDSGSRTKKPFGRVFYTQGKSLIFYAFDLDRQRGLVNASTFQVWGQKEMAQGEQALPLNLGILYMDNETNRRWVMRFDDPKQLAEIDAVFVTVEPRGGSQKPTSKPFLYALLRNDANHP